MITRIRTGLYKLIETKHHIKILYLDDQVFAWPETAHYGEMLVVSHKPHKTDCILGLGQYNIYNVVNEPDVSDHIHMELQVGGDHWQGYLLLTGLPDARKNKARIIPTNEVITGHFSYGVVPPWQQRRHAYAE